MSDVADECDTHADIRREAERQRRLPLRPIRRSKLQVLARARTDARRFNGRPAVLALRLVTEQPQADSELAGRGSGGDGGPQQSGNEARQVGPPVPSELLAEDGPVQ